MFAITDFYGSLPFRTGVSCNYFYSAVGAADYTWYGPDNYTILLSRK